MTEIICRHGSPQVILSDNGTNFTSKVITNLVDLMGSHQDFSAPYNPSTNGAVERANGTLVNILRKISYRDSTHWDRYLPSALLAYQLSYHRITGQSPFAMLYGREAMTPSLVFPNLNNQASAVNPRKHVLKLALQIIKLQRQAYSKA